MAKGTRGRRGVASRQCRQTPYPLPSNKKNLGMQQKSFAKSFKKDWEDATCSVCMECPHNAVLLLCSSYEKGCRPYMCGTSFRYSNCLDQYEKAYTKVTPESRALHDSHNGQATSPFSGQSVTNAEATELSCPLCRGQVKGWTVVEPAREHLNSKKRNCTQDNCFFIGTFKELRKHVRAKHPSAKPREVDPTLEQKWRSLERERERDDVISTIRSSMPGAVVFGDYVLEGNQYGFDSDNEAFDSDADAMESGSDRNLMSLFLFLQAFRSAGNTLTRNRGAMGLTHTFDYSDQDHDNDNDQEDNNGISLANRLRRQGRVILGRSGRRRRRREAGR